MTKQVILGNNALTVDADGTVKSKGQAHGMKFFRRPKTINYPRLAGYACLSWLGIYLIVGVSGNIIDKIRPEWLLWLYGG